MAMDKIYAFDYMITLLNEWREAFNTGNTCRVLSKLSVLKLLFLVKIINFMLEVLNKINVN